MLTVRKRGAIWHCRGTVRVGAKVRDVKEHSTGLGEQAAAQNYAARLARDIQDELLYGRAGRARRLTFAEAGRLYIERPEGLHPNDAWRIGELNEILGDVVIADLAGPEGWTRFVRERCKDLAPATTARFRAVLVAALNHAAAPLGFDVPTLPAVRFKNDRLRFLTLADADRLIDAYPDHVRPIALLLRYTGCRTQEALQLGRRHLDLERGTVFFERTKNGLPRTVKLHLRAHDAIARMIAARAADDRRRRGDIPAEILKEAAATFVFLNRVGLPYADTRDYKFPGGNPLRASHAAALRRATIAPIGGPDFTVHDWRHHWASWCVMHGIDLPTIQRMGGWKTLRMVERYAGVSTDHQDAAIGKMA